jgi:hypothetical protein
MTIPICGKAIPVIERLVRGKQVDINPGLEDDLNLNGSLYDGWSAAVVAVLLCGLEVMAGAAVFCWSGCCYVMNKSYFKKFKMNLSDMKKNSSKNPIRLCVAVCSQKFR